MIHDQLIKKGDLNQVKAIRFLYCLDLIEKDELIQLAAKQDLTPYQIAEVDLKVAKLTGELRRKDSLINYLVFGIAMEENQVTRSVYWYWEKLKNQDERKRVKQLRDALREKTISLAELSDKYSRLAVLNSDLKKVPSV